ncbi:MAG: enoyl-CoA hydratase/isomerase family protein [Pseudomonadota bacterium]
MSTEDVHLEVSDYIAVVTLDRPPANPLNSNARQCLTKIFDEITDRKDVRVAVLTGAGKIFCSGADLKDRPSTKDPGQYWLHNRIVRETGNSIKECSKPVIAAVNGPALGAGMGLAMSCDILIASENAVFGLPEINVGLAGGAAMLQEHFGRSRLRRLLYTGMRMPAAEMYRLGLIEASVPPEQLMPEALKIAAEIAEKNPLGIRFAKLSANMVQLMPQRDAYRFEQNFTVELSKTENAAEARRAFAEKRKPVYKDD